MINWLLFCAHWIVLAENPALLLISGMLDTLDLGVPFKGWLVCWAFCQNEFNEAGAPRAWDEHCPKWPFLAEVVNQEWIIYRNLGILHSCSRVGAARARLSREGPRAGLGPSPRTFCRQASGLSIYIATSLRTTPPTMAKQENSF